MPRNLNDVTVLDVHEATTAPPPYEFSAYGTGPYGRGPYGYKTPIFTATVTEHQRLIRIEPVT